MLDEGKVLKGRGWLGRLLWGRLWCCGGRVEEVVVVRVAAQGSTEGDWEGWDVDVEEALVRAVGRGARPKRWWAEMEEAAVEGADGAGVDVADFVFSVLLVGQDFKGAAFADGQLTDAVVSGGALNFNGGEHKVPRFVKFEFAGGVRSVGGKEAAVFGEITEDIGGECGLGVAEAKKFVKIGGASVVGELGGDGGWVAVEGKAEGSSDSGNAANDVSAINRGSVPSVDGDVDGFDSDFGVASALVGGDGDGFVQETEEAFDGDRLMVVAKAWFVGQTRRQNPTRRRTCFMKMDARVAESRVSNSETMPKPVRSHMAPRMYLEPS